MNNWSSPISNQAQGRALSDTLAAEREMRSHSEEAIRAFKGLLSEIANRYDGTRLEEMRRANPNGVATWGPNEWTKFFRDIPVQQSGISGWGVTTQSDPALAKENKKLKAKLAALQAELDQALDSDIQPAVETPQTPAKPIAVSPPLAVLPPLPAKPKLQTTSTQQVRGKKKTSGAKKRDPKVEKKVEERIASLGKPETIPEGYSGSLASILADLSAKQKDFPKKPPGRFRQILDGKGRTGKDLELAYERYWSTLWLLGRWSINSKLEIETLIALSNTLSTRSGALGRVITDLLNANILVETLLRLSKAPGSALKLVQLAEEGRELFKLLFGTEPIRDELAVMYEKHEGERFPDHTLAVLIFALHARRRGWATRLMPSVEGKAAPDLVVRRGENQLYVEVERGQKEKTSKWEGIAKLNGGKVALCAMTESFQASLVSDCVRNNSGVIKHGVATNLKGLVNVRYDDVTATTPLWLQEW